MNHEPILFSLHGLSVRKKREALQEIKEKLLKNWDLEQNKTQGDLNGQTGNYHRKAHLPSIFTDQPGEQGEHH